jgi:predicted ATPase/Flp pilus assembly protein TadD
MSGRVWEIIAQLVAGVLASLVVIVAGALVARWYSPRRRELLGAYEQNLRQVFALSRGKARRVLGDRSLQRQLLNPTVGLDQEWTLLQEELRTSGVAAEALTTPAAFYRELVTDLELSNHWRDRGRSLAEQLQSAQRPASLAPTVPGESDEVAVDPARRSGDVAVDPARRSGAGPGGDRSSAPARYPLPVPAGPFIGREAEVGEWRELLLQPVTRLLTLVAFGGMGKTRAALELARRCADDFADGVCWVEIEEARTGEEMVERIADRLRLPLEPPPSAKEKLFAFLSSQRLLLVLDNTEQVSEAADVVGELLSGVDALKCLVTSRRPLELQTERLIEMGPLPATDAERLFAERARARQATFAISQDNAGDVAELCRRLEGVPLAIELAASRIAAMSPREILGHLDERLRLLQTRSPDLRPRQRALRGAIDWSYELLGAAERALFAPLAVFAGGFTMADAEAVIGMQEGLGQLGNWQTDRRPANSPIPQFPDLLPPADVDVLEGVADLRRQSLLRAEVEAATQRTRFFMLESVREYAAEKLAETQDRGVAVRERHARHFLEFAGQCAARIRTPEEGRSLEEMASALDNVRAALAWSEQARQHGLGAGIALALAQVLHRIGFWAEAQRCLRAGLSAAEGIEGGDPGLKAALLHNLGSLSYDLGDAAAAREQAEASLALRQERQDCLGTAETLNLCGFLSLADGELDGAEGLLKEALALLDAPNHTLRGIVLHNLALVRRRRGEMDEAERLYQESLAQQRQAGDARGQAETLGDLGALAYRGEDYVEARRLYRESLDLFRSLRDRRGIAAQLYNLGELEERDDDHYTAVALYIHAGRLFRELQSPLAAIPTEALQRLKEQLGPERWEPVLAAAESATWEEALAPRAAAGGP